ncbi:alkaline phosphatase [Kipferlia bialata]|uniref:alkaline phosphatase n=1 Tax=Kipferlia bialata TaxID=797122 RepID=A0A9K3GGS4_9EUKA|nr:alkaline phosphatase [Kipferlia bialata]|eukprot:g4731.t1
MLKPLVLLCTLCVVVYVSAQDNLILFIGDGMGYNHIEMSRLVEMGDTEGVLSFEDLEYSTTIGTNALSLLFTDSAAAATCISSGQKVARGRLNVSRLFHKHYETLLEYLTDTEEGRDYLTGVIAKTTLYHATPAGFMAHSTSRGHSEEIAACIIADQPDLLMGGGGTHLSSLLDSAAQYATDRSHLRDLTSDLPVVGLFAEDDMKKVVHRDPDSDETEPTLTEMVVAAVGVLEAASAEQARPYVLVVEASFPDKGSHSNDADIAITEVIELHEAVREVLSLIDLSETLLVVTADHECGALEFDTDLARDTLADASLTSLETLAGTDYDAVTLQRTERIALLDDAYSWGSTHHTYRPVMLAASGPGADGINDLDGRLLHHKGTSLLLHRVADPGYQASKNFGYIGG